MELERSTLADWVGSTSNLLGPLNEALRQHVMSASKLHADDTLVPVLEPGKGRTKTGRLWTYVRDERPAGQTTAPAVWFAYTPDRSGKHPNQHLAKFKGMLQADAYAGFNPLYANGRVQEAVCWAHVRHKFFDIQRAYASPLAGKLLSALRSPMRLKVKSGAGRQMSASRHAKLVRGHCLPHYMNGCRTH